MDMIMGVQHVPTEDARLQSRWYSALFAIRHVVFMSHPLLISIIQLTQIAWAEGGMYEGKEQVYQEKSSHRWVPLLKCLMHNVHPSRMDTELGSAMNSDITFWDVCMSWLMTKDNDTGYSIMLLYEEIRPVIPAATYGGCLGLLEFSPSLTQIRARW